MFTGVDSSTWSVKCNCGWEKHWLWRKTPLKSISTSKFWTQDEKFVSTRSAYHVILLHAAGVAEEAEATSAF